MLTSRVITREKVVYLYPALIQYKVQSHPSMQVWFWIPQKRIPGNYRWLPGELYLHPMHEMTRQANSNALRKAPGQENLMVNMGYEGRSMQSPSRISTLGFLKLADGRQNIGRIDGRHARFVCNNPSSRWLMIWRDGLACHWKALLLLSIHGIARKSIHAVWTGATLPKMEM